MDRESDREEAEELNKALEWMRRAAPARLDGLLAFAEKLATLAAAIVAVGASFLGGASGPAQWLLRGSYLGFMACVLGFLLIRVAVISIQGRLIRSAGDTKRVPRVEWLADRRFTVGNHLLTWGFSLGVVLLALFALFK
jgi:hypothetical protein